jgi:predicted aldo/keto reductase-like oxidoreductase
MLEISAMDRRAFLQKTAAGVRAAIVGSILVGHSGCSILNSRSKIRKLLSANDIVTLGNTGIKTSRLAIGSGSNGAEQQRRGIFLKEVKREKVVVTSKTLAKDAPGVRSDVERFRTELGTDYIDILLLHCMSDPAWPEKMKGSMEALSEAKEKGYVRAIGCSLHILEALEAACKEPWGDVYVVRINPFAVNMDVDRVTEIPKVERAIEKLNGQRKAVYGMKLLGGTNPHIRKSRLQGDKIDESLRFILSRPCLAGFTIGFSQEKHIDDIMQRISRVQQFAGEKKS